MDAQLTFFPDIIKFFGFELGAQTNTNPADDRWIINGAHEASKLQDHLDGYINKFVLCKKCKNPETDTKVKDGDITLDCKACGQRSAVDLRQKLSGFILKNEPKKGKKDKLDKKARRARAKQNGDSAEQNGNGHSPGDSNSDNAEGDADGDVGVEAGSDDELTRRINAEAKDLEDKPEAKDDIWTFDVSEEAAKARAKELPDDLKQKLVFDDGDEDGEGENGTSPYDQLGSWIMETATAKGGIAKVDDVDIYVKAKEFGIEGKHKTLTVLAQTIFDEDIVAQVPKRASMLKKVRHSLSVTHNFFTYHLVADDHIRKARKGLPRRHRTLRRQRAPKADPTSPQDPHGLLPRRSHHRRGSQGLVPQGEQALRRASHQQEGP